MNAKPYPSAAYATKRALRELAAVSNLSGGEVRVNARARVNVNVRARIKVSAGVRVRGIWGASEGNL